VTFQKYLFKKYTDLSHSVPFNISVMARKASSKRKGPLVMDSMTETSSSSIVNDEAKTDVTKPMDQVETHFDETTMVALPQVVEGNASCTPTESKSQQDVPNLDAVASIDNSHDNEEEELEEQWDLAHILTIEEILSNGGQRCMSKRCPLLACCKYVSNLDPANVWYCCVDCQEKDYGGWPDSHDLPIQSLSLEHRATIVEKCSGRYEPDMPKLPTSLDHSSEERTQSTPNVLETEADTDTLQCHQQPLESDIPLQRRQTSTRASPIPMTADVMELSHDATKNDLEGTTSEEAEEKWDLTHIFSVEEINAAAAQRCMNRRCPLLACCKYVSSLDPSNVWFCCVDCQEKDYGGWPESHELPIECMSEEHCAVIIEKCSGRYSPDMPNFSFFSGDASDKLDQDAPHTITPLPNKVSKSLDKKSADQLDHKLKKSAITQSPVPVGPSKQALAIHQKWYETAKSLGGDKLIVNKECAKKVIFDLLHNAFRPMNITDTFNVRYFFLHFLCYTIQIF